ncbi:MAG: hypothetical protein WA269_05120 [Candidatus Udaeobacter sp.]
MRALVLIAMFLSACDTLNIQQYRVAGGAHRDVAKVKRVLHDVANQTGLVDRTSTSRAPRTVVFYTQPDVQHFRVDLGARILGDDVVVDLNGGFGPARPEFKQAAHLLTPALSGELGSRLTVMPLGTQSIPVTTQ